MGILFSRVFQALFGSKEVRARQARSNVGSVMADIVTAASYVAGADLGSWT
jgi:hypothetical protein